MPPGAGGRRTREAVRPALSPVRRWPAGRLDRWAWWCGCLLVVACLVNGGVYWLKRTGLIEREAYRQDMAALCEGAAPRWTGGSCWFWKSSSTPVAAPLAKARPAERLYRVEGIELASKALKHLVVAGLLVLSVVGMVWGRLEPVGWRAMMPAAPLAASLLVAAGITLVCHDPGVLLAGLLAMGYLALVGTASWLGTPDRLRQLVRCMAVLLVVQLALVLVEVVLGVPLAFGPPGTGPGAWSQALPTRMAGTLVQPNSLGVLVVVVLALRHVDPRDRRSFTVLDAVGLALILLARSGTGLALLLILTGWVAATRVRPRASPRARLALLLLLVALAAALPQVLGRPDLYTSIFGRLDGLARYLDVADRVTIWWGDGLGAGTNAMRNWIRAHPTDWREGLPFAMRLRDPDSSLTLLLMQVGLLGVMGFYGLVLWACRSDPGARPFYAVVAVASLVQNLHELFPVNVLLAIVLARSLRMASMRQCPAMPT